MNTVPKLVISRKILWQLNNNVFSLFLFQYLVTAAKDGSIKVWDDECNIKIVFIGHLNSVSSVALYPFGPYIMSGSLDSTIRVWSLDTYDEVDRILTKQPIRGLCTTAGGDDLFSYSSDGFQVWKIEHIHSPFTVIGYGP